MISRDRLVKSFCELARIDSPSGEEEAIAQHLVARLEALSLKVSRDSYGNVIATDGREKPFLLSAHMDTVEPGRGVKPRVQGERIVSDGTTILGGDCKAGLAAILEALQSMTEDGTPRVGVEVAFTRKEETGLAGARNLDFSRITAREAIVLDREGPPSRITSASPAYIGFDIDITGRAAHAGVDPERGLSAIRIAAEVVSKLPQGRLDDETTFNVGTIGGGTVRNAVPEHAAVRGEFRSINPRTLERTQRQLEGVLDEARRLFPEALIEHHLEREFEAYVLTEKDPATRRVMAALKSLGLEPDMRTSGGGSDANVFRHKGIGAVVVGMADHHLHTVREYVSIPDLVDAARLCETLLRA